MRLQHPAGTARMGKVVGTEFRVRGVSGLRVVDASVIPTPIRYPIQATVYALGERAVESILVEECSFRRQQDRISRWRQKRQGISDVLI